MMEELQIAQGVMMLMLNYYKILDNANVNPLMKTKLHYLILIVNALILANTTALNVSANPDITVQVLKTLAVLCVRRTAMGKIVVLMVVILYASVSLDYFSILKTNSALHSVAMNNERILLIIHASNVIHLVKNV
mmetsp:Transcript_13773/g.2207  ORF Transcript_13773/g.2207 Transcript_13773/m.2207 type:complete len:135 (-) Transcript_13773:571-975(-)